VKPLPSSVGKTEKEVHTTPPKDATLNPADGERLLIKRAKVTAKKQEGKKAYDRDLGFVHRAFRWTE